MAAARSMWNGAIRFGDVSLAVKLHAAVEDRTVRFHLLHDRDKQRVRQRMVDPESGEEVPKEQIRRGIEVEPGVFVLIEDEDLAKLEPEGSRDIEVSRFIPTSNNYAWYERPYFLSPDGDPQAYFGLARALARTKREGIARWVMRKRHYVGALREEAGYLMLVALRHAGEVVDAQALPAPDGPALGEKELAMAEQLVAMLEAEYDPEAFHDEYRKRLEDLIEAKSKGKLYKFEKPAPKRPAEDLAQALSASLSKLRRERQSA